MAAFASEAREALLSGDNGWIPWNLFLAAIPLALSFPLFRWSRRHGPLWWTGLVAFVVFLPNAPYVLTDVVHLIDAVEDDRWSPYVITLVLVPLYAVVLGLAFEAYVVSLLNVAHTLHRTGRSRLVLPVELALHALVAIGIYLGRFERFNSWAVVTRVDDLTGTVLDTFASRRPVVLFAVTFVVVAALYWVAKWLTLALVTWWRLQRPSLEQLERLRQRERAGRDAP